jgi:hypothetical protein
MDRTGVLGNDDIDKHQKIINRLYNLNAPPYNWKRNRKIIYKKE